MAYYPLAHPRPDIAAQFRQNILEAGGAVIGENGDVLRPGDRHEPPRRSRGRAVPQPEVRAPSREPLPTVIELEDEPERTVAIKRRNGERVELHVSLRFGALRQLGILQAEGTRLAEAATTATDRATLQDISDQQFAIAEQVLGLVFDDVPAGLLDTLDPRMVRRLIDTSRRIVQDAVGAEDGPVPNARAGA